MSCPYPNCSGEFSSLRHVSPCATCRQPVFRCPKCGSGNRAFARYCRQCRASIAKKDKLENRDSVEKRDFSSVSREIVISGSFWVRPISYCGYFWCLSRNGEVLRISPFVDQAAPYGVLGQDYGASSVTIAELSAHSGGESLVPFLIAAGPRGIKGVNLLTGVVKEFYSTQAGERILADSSEKYTNVASDRGRIFFLKTDNQRTQLVATDGIDCLEVEVPTSDVAGPFVVEGRAFVCSCDCLYVLDGDQIIPYLDFKTIHFRPWISPSEITNLLPPFGVSPYLVRQHSVYLPGIRTGQQTDPRGESSLAGNRAGLLFVSVTGSMPKYAFIPIPGDATLSQDSVGRPIVSRASEIAAYEETTSVTLRRDTQLVAKGQAYHEGQLTIGFARTTGGVESLRFYEADHITDFSLAPMRNLIDIGFFSVAGTLLFAYQAERDQGRLMRIATWVV